MLSVIIPSRQPQYLQKTIDDLLVKAEGEIEIIVILDGYWPDPIIRDDARVKILHHGMFHDNYGMRASINKGVAISIGTHILKCDEHTMWDQGYDLKLKADCEDDWVVIPRRYRLDAEEWKIIEDGRPPIDYMQLDYPYKRPYDRTCGLYGAEDRERGYQRAEHLIDDVMTMQGSAYFMTRKHWDNCIGQLDAEHYGQFNHEAQEISNKTWLSGGRVIVNKKTWYAHLHKGKSGKGYGFTTEQYKNHQVSKEKARLYAIDYWLNTKDYKYDFDWLLKKFNPKGWPENWQEQVEIDKLKDFSTLNYPDVEGEFNWLEGLRK
jgi:glycosyltransferase involved in cell wall biosynthesis